MIWTDEKIQRLVELYPITENSELVDLLNIKRGTIIAKANSLDLYKDLDFMSMSRKKRPQCRQVEWTEDEEFFILDNYKKLSNSEISLMLNKTKKSVIRKLSRMGIKRSKEESDFLRAKKSKENGRDLSYEFVKKESMKYNTLSEFSYHDNTSYCKAKKYGWINEFSHLKIGGSISIPQLILMDILEHFLNEKCSFNNRKIINPLEIDCYFYKWKVGWEYNGRRFHIDDSRDNLKKLKCIEAGVSLFIIDEKSDDYRDYVKNIKNQLLKQIKEVYEITGVLINENDLNEYTPRIDFLFMLKFNEIERCQYKKLSEIRKAEPELYKKLKKYNLLDCPKLNILNDIKKLKRFKNLDEHIEYLVEVKDSYKSFSELAMNEHLYRKIKFYKVTIDYIREKIGFTQK